MGEIERRQIWVDHDVDNGSLSIHFTPGELDQITLVGKLMQGLRVTYDPDNPGSDVTLTIPVISRIKDLE